MQAGFDPAVGRRLELPRGIRDLVAGEFAGASGRGPGLALLLDDGSVRVLRRDSRGGGSPHEYVRLDDVLPRLLYEKECG